VVTGQMVTQPGRLPIGHLPIMENDV